MAQLLLDASPDVRLAAAQGLAQLVAHTNSPVPALLLRLRTSESDKERAAAATALGRYYDQQYCYY